MRRQYNPLSCKHRFTLLDTKKCHERTTEICRNLKIKIHDDYYGDADDDDDDEDDG